MFVCNMQKLTDWNLVGLEALYSTLYTTWKTYKKSHGTTAMTVPWIVIHAMMVLSVKVAHACYTAYYMFNKAGVQEG